MVSSTGFWDFSMPYIIFWWLDQTPYYAQFDDEDEADAAARVRNAMMLEVGSLKSAPVDYYRRDENGAPLPAVERKLKKTIPRPAQSGGEPTNRRPRLPMS